MIVARRSKWTAFLIAVAMILSLLSFVSVSNAAEATDLEWWNFRNNYENNGVTDRQTVDTKEEANLKWGQKYGTGYAAAPTPPIIIDGYLYIASGKKVLKIDRATGECVKSGGDMVANVGYAMNPIVYADGKFFVQVGNGRIQAVDFETLDPVWCSENIGGQTVSPISYKKIDGVGYLYTGTWGGEKADGNFFCITTDDDNVVEGVKQLTWKFKPSEDDPDLEGSQHKKRGFYWAGAYVSENFVAVGSDDGTSEGDYTANGVFYTFDPKTGKIIDRIDQIKGDARSTIVYDNGYMYFNTKGGLLYRTKVDSTGHLSQTSIYDLGGMSTACPVVYNNRLYIGVCGTGGQFDPDAGHHFSVLDVSGDLTPDSLIYDIPIKGYPQAGALLSTGNANKDYNGDGSPDNRVYIYFTYNANPGGLYYLYDEPGKTTLSSDQYGELFTPPTAMQQYCISTVIADRDGVMYYKNDSSYLMAVEKNPAYLENAVITTDKDKSPKWSKDFDMGQLEGYNVKVDTDSTVASMTLTLPEGTTATVNDVPYTGSASEVMLSTEGDVTAVDVVVAKNGATRTYKFNIVKQGGNSKLSDLRVTLANTYTSSIQVINPTFSEEATDYETNYITKLQGSAPNNFASIWPVPADTSATVKVFTGDNAKAGSKDTERNADGSMKVTATNSGKQRYAIYFANADKDAKVRIEVISENGRSKTEYNLTLARTIHVASIELDRDSITIEERKNETVNATVLPVNALDKSVTWSSSDKSIAAVDENGKVTGISPGRATITVATNDGELTDTCDVEVVEHKHVWGEWESVDPSTCIKEGQEMRICQKDSEHIEYRYTDLLEHQLVKNEAKASTCIKYGNIEHWKCSVCEKLFINAEGTVEISEGDVVIPVYGDHDYQDVDGTAQDATCTDAGREANQKCSVCNDEKEGKVIPALDHLWLEPEYLWTNDNSSVTAHRVCERDRAHEESETVNTSSVVAQEPTTTTEGIKIYTATFTNPAFSKQTKDVTIPKKVDPNPTVDPKDQMGSDGTAFGPGASAEAVEAAIAAMTSDKDPAGTVYGKLRLRSTRQGKNSIKLAWNKVGGAEKYVVYGNVCGKNNKMTKLTASAKSSYNVKKISKKLKKGTYYKFMLVALDQNDKVISSSKVIYVATSGGKVANHKNLTAKAKIGKKTKVVGKVTIKKGKILKLKTTLKPKSKKLKVKKHVGPRYESTDTRIATVSGKGVIKAKAKGTCHVYVYAQNGAFKKVKVTVK